MPLQQATDWTLRSKKGKETGLGSERAPLGLLVIVCLFLRSLWYTKPVGPAGSAVNTLLLAGF